MDFSAKLGLGLGIALGLLLIVLSYFHVPVGVVYIDLLLIYAICIVYGIYRFKRLTSTTAFKDLFKAGLKISSLAALMLSIAIYIHHKYIDESWVAKQTKQYGEWLGKQKEWVGVTADKINVETGKYISTFPFKMSILTLAQFICLGALVTLVTSAILHRRKA